jgi:hypothetical protein
MGRGWASAGPPRRHRAPSAATAAYARGRPGARRLALRSQPGLKSVPHRWPRATARTCHRASDRRRAPVEPERIEDVVGQLPRMLPWKTVADRVGEAWPGRSKRERLVLRCLWADRRGSSTPFTSAVPDAAAAASRDGSPAWSLLDVGGQCRPAWRLHPAWRSKNVPLGSSERSRGTLPSWWRGNVPRDVQTGSSGTFFSLALPSQGPRLASEPALRRPLRRPRPQFCYRTAAGPRATRAPGAGTTLSSGAFVLDPDGNNVEAVDHG